MLPVSDLLPSAIPLRFVQGAVLAAIMKFRDGMWLQARDIRSEYAEEVYSAAARENGKQLSLCCPTKKIRARSDSLNLSTLTIVGMPEHGRQMASPNGSSGS